MAGSTIGTIFKITTWGESHGKGVGVVIDGCPAGLTLNEDIIQSYLNRRKPGQTKFSTPRKENDLVTIESGVFMGLTTGTPISLTVKNETHRSTDYSEISNYYRPGHADYTFDEKYGFRDYRGGGRSSGRETIGRVAAGAVACEILKQLGINITAYTRSIGPVTINYANCNKNYLKESPLVMPDKAACEKAQAVLSECMEKGDSIGGTIECIISGMPAGIGDPVFDKLDSSLAKAVMSIGSIKGFELGAGFMAAQMNGSECNDAFFYDENKTLHKKTNNAGGILGGISDGSEIIFRAAVKPTPSIFLPQETINKAKENEIISIKGRHDPVIVPRAVVVVEAMAAITVLDLLLTNMTSQLKKIQEFYHR